MEQVRKAGTAEERNKRTQIQVQRDVLQVKGVTAAIVVMNNFSVEMTVDKRPISPFISTQRGSKHFRRCP